MNERIQRARPELAAICLRHNVRTLDLFSSTVVTGYSPTTGDLDLVVEFGPFPTGGYSEHFFGLIEDLTTLFDRPIHLLVARAVRNPFLLRSINQTRESLFADGNVRDTSELAQVTQIADRELTSVDEQKAVFGFRPFPTRDGSVTNRMIDELRAKGTD